MIHPASLKFLKQFLSVGLQKPPTTFRSSGGFGMTLIEILVSITLLASMTIISIAKFRTIQEDDVLDLAASRLSGALREAQNFAQNGRRQDYALASAFGVSIVKATNSAIVFADLNTKVEQGKWNGDTPDDAGKKDIKIETVSFDVDKKGSVILDKILVEGVDFTLVDIAFKAQTASSLINSLGAGTNTVVLTFKNKKTNHTKTLSFNRVTGRVDKAP